MQAKYLVPYCCNRDSLKEPRALRPPYESKNEIRFSPNSSYKSIRTMAQVYKSYISLTLTVAMVTKCPPNRLKVEELPFWTKFETFD